MDILKIKDGDCIVLESMKDALMVHGKDGKIYYRVVLKDYKSINVEFKCPNANLNDGEEGVICGIGYACDACPYNPDLKENYKGVRSKW